MADKTIRSINIANQGAVDVLYRDVGSGYAQAQAIAPTTTLSTAAPLTGQVTVTTAGTPVQGDTVTLTNGAMIWVKPTNTSSAFVGNNGASTVTSTSGVIMTTTVNNVIITYVDNLNKVWFDALVSGEGFCWMKM